MKKNCILFFFMVVSGLPGLFAQYSYDSVTFEVQVNTIVINNPGHSTWQIGTPQKNYFNAAYQGTRAILTDSLDVYPPNDTSSFIYIIRNPYTQTCMTKR
jgi:hypothetical protein